MTSWKETSWERNETNRGVGRIKGLREYGWIGGIELGCGNRWVSGSRVMGGGALLLNEARLISRRGDAENNNCASLT